MAYRDESGRITIDEVAAGQDVQSLGAAEESLRQVAGHLNETAAQAGEFSGATGEAIVDVARQMAGDVQASAERARELRELIEATVRKYQAIDQTLKANFESFG